MAAFRLLSIQLIVVSVNSELVSRDANLVLIQKSASRIEADTEDDVIKPGKNPEEAVENKHTWTEFKKKYSAGYAADFKHRFGTLGEAQAKCVQLGTDYCQAVTCDKEGHCSVRASATLTNSQRDETTYLISGFELATTCNTDGGCAIFDDQHVRVFDGFKISLLEKPQLPDMNDHLIKLMTKASSGDMWLVKSDNVQIQVRYLPSKKHQHRVKVRSVAVGGAFLNGSKLIVEPLDGAITWNGDEILTEDESEFIGDGLISATRHNFSCMVEDMSRRHPGIDIKLPRGVKLTVNRQPQHVNVHISMPQLKGGQEGLCGNNNGVASDDELELMIEKRPPTVAASESLLTPIETGVFTTLYSFFR